MARDTRPYVHAELGVPYDEYQMACWLCSEGAVDQLADRLGGLPGDRWRPRLLSAISSDDEVARQADKIARRASKRLHLEMRRARRRT